MTLPASRLPAVGDVLAGKYRLLDVLGRGGMGIVFEAHHELLDRRVAIKVLAPEVLGNHEAVTRFLNEARAAARITSDRVVQVLDVGLLADGLPFMVMERLEGLDLAQLLHNQGPIAVEDVVDLLLEGLEGVAHAHFEGIVHRDLKPSNLFLARRPDRTSAVKVLDFGISKITAADPSRGGVTATSTVIGSPLYMSPEQLRSAKWIDARADIWSFGVIAYELLTQTLPFRGENVVDIFAAIQERDVQPLCAVRADVPAALDEVVRRCLRRAPDDRFKDAFSLARALTPFGGKRAKAAMERLVVHAASKGLAAGVELDTTLVAPSAQGAEPARSTPAQAASAPITPSKSSPLGATHAEATSSPWATTGSKAAAPPRRGGRLAFVATLALLLAAAGAVTAYLVVRVRTPPVSKIEATPAVAATVSVSLPAATSAAPPLGSPAVVDVPAPVATPPPATARSPRAPAPAPTTAAHHSSVAPSATTASKPPPPAPAASPSKPIDPLNMKPLE